MQNNDLLRQAVSLALAGDWHAAHNIVQDLNTHDACWIHAVLHKIEGDAWNSRYWYVRTTRQYQDYADAQAELHAIKKHLIK
jgi:hypothetical protein